MPLRDLTRRQDAQMSSFTILTTVIADTDVSIWYGVDSNGRL